MSDTNTVHVAFAIDRGLVKQLCVTLYSVLRHRDGATNVMLLSTELTEEDLHPIRKTVEHFPDATLTVQPFALEQEDLRAISLGHLTATTLARIFLPDFVEGRVLYLDADILVLEDIAPLFHADMQGHAIAGVRDMPIQMQSDFLALAQSGKKVVARDLERSEDGIAAFCAAYPWRDPATYVNAGVLLMDCAAMRKDAVRYAELRDVAQAAEYPFLDQDHINRTYGAEKALLPLRWNRLAGNVSEGMMRRYRKAFGEQDTAGLYHYAGPRKPWHSWRNWRYSAGPMKMLRWRMECWLWQFNLRRALSNAAAKSGSSLG